MERHGNERFEHAVFKALVDEVLQRYDTDGLEQDACGTDTSVGKGTSGRHHGDDALVADLRRLSKAAERRWKRSAKLSETCRPDCGSPVAPRTLLRNRSWGVTTWLPGVGIGTRLGIASAE